GDIEFVAELLIGILHGPQGGNPATIDDYYQQYEDYEDEFPEQKTVMRVFGEALGLVRELFPAIKTTRWANKTDFYSVFVMLSSLLRTSVISDAHKDSLKRALQRFERDVEKRIQDERAQ